MKKLFSLLISLALLLTLGAPALGTEHIERSSGSSGICAYIDRLTPGEIGSAGGEQTIASDDQGAIQIQLIRMELPGGITAGQVEQAYLHLYLKEGDPLTGVTVGRVTKTWTLVDTTWDAMHGAVAFEPGVTGEAVDGGNWYRFDVSELVKAWLRGDWANYGFALQQTEHNRSSVIASVYEDEDTELCPKLIIEYTQEEGVGPYGKFSYTPQEVGNCFSYALRDTSPIYVDKILPTDEAVEAFEAAIVQGRGAVHFADLVLAYIKENGEALEISSVRLVEAGEEIDPETEYLMALRLGFHDRNGVEGIQVLQDDFDYHFRVRLDSGAWAEMFPMTLSRIVPGTNRENSLNDIPWDASYVMGNWKWHEYYDSQAFYFAIGKDTDDFTAHLDGETDTKADAFDDIEGHWANQEINHLAERGVLRGDNGSVRPDDPITRAELAVIIDRVTDHWAESETVFDDIPEIAWYRDSMLRLNAAGILLGNGNLLRPLDHVTREEAVVLLARAFGVEAGDGAASPFPDHGEIAFWAIDLVYTMKEMGYIQGDGAGCFCPKSNVTRGEAARMIFDMTREA